MFIDDESHVNNIAVDPSWQGRGLGAAILADLVRTGLAHGARHLTLEVRVGNDPAIALYRRFGMAPVGSVPTTTRRPATTPSSCGPGTSTPIEYSERLAAIEGTVSARLEVSSRR